MQVHDTARETPRAPVVTVQALCPEMVYIMADNHFWQRFTAGEVVRRSRIPHRIANYVRHHLSNYDALMGQAQTERQRLEIRRQVYAQTARYYPVTRKHCARCMRFHYRRYAARGQI